MTDQQTLTVVPSVDYVPGRAVVPAQTDVALNIQATIERHNLVVRFVKEVLVKDVDYGQTGGSKKPFLWKPGAEKLAAFFAYHPWLERVTCTEDWETPFFAYAYICKVMHGTQLVATCEGASNSKEPSYAKQNPYSLQNAVMKRAQKRALVGAVQIATSSTEFFSQALAYIDHEDEDEQAEAKTEAKPEPKAEVKPEAKPGAADQELSEAAQIIQRLHENAAKIKNAKDIPPGAQGLLKGKIAEALRDRDDKIRHLLLRHIWGKEHVAELTYAEFNATANWFVGPKDPHTGDYPLKPEGVRELLLVAQEAQIQAGQLKIEDLFGPGPEVELKPRG